VNAGGGMLDPCVVVVREVIGTWRRTAGRREVTIEIDPFEPRAYARRLGCGRAESKKARSGAPRPVRSQAKAA